MDTLLDDVEARVLGVLLEKEKTTPEYYPLTLNALTTACNQKSNRNPVVSFDEKTVVRALDGLRDKQLVRQLSGAEMRVPKYYHLCRETFDLADAPLVAIAVLLLRGPQTLGEIRGRSQRMFEFTDLGHVEQTLRELEERANGAFVRILPRQPGRKESRYAHLLAGEPEIAEPATEVSPEAATLTVRAENERIESLETDVAALKEELADLRQAFGDFRQQFD
jgi:uncharacterized protein YceH (UPF0502 family)